MKNFLINFSQTNYVIQVEFCCIFVYNIVIKGDIDEK